MLAIAPIVASAALGLAGATPAFALPPAHPTNTSCGNATAAAVILDNFTSVETAAHHNAPDGRISHNDLVATGRFENGHPLRVQSAANHVLRTPGLESQIDTAAHGGNPDNNISRNDLRHEIAQQIWLTREVDNLLDEIDDVLAEGAEEFVRQYCQNGGS
ncbi:ubiquitin-like protein Pup [Streptomyces phyllanthi]|uniref:Prokaryotic ubiquitin-like protein Pup n=2 Tax=Streptomyces phyllanthi TaxID=1803180 RepID=A0A5N8W321_9ACTN|nr:ubiquitin-like protein Pup [Streptomyces phyllanthi]